MLTLDPAQYQINIATPNWLHSLKSNTQYCRMKSYPRSKALKSKLNQKHTEIGCEFMFSPRKPNQDHNHVSKCTYIHDFQCCHIAIDICPA
jgi:hypothetical protein